MIGVRLLDFISYILLESQTDDLLLITSTDRSVIYHSLLGLWTWSEAPFCAAKKERPTRDGTEPTDILGKGDSSILILMEESSCLSLVPDDRIKNLRRLDTAHFVVTKRLDSYKAKLGNCLHHRSINCGCLSLHVYIRPTY